MTCAVPCGRFTGYAELEEALAPLEAIKVATWWRTALPVWRASVLHGIPVYFVQDIETSYYRDDPDRRFEVLNSYRPEFRFLTISRWNQEQLTALGLESELIPPGLDDVTFGPREGIARRDDMILALGRTDPLKNLPLTLQAWRRLPAPRPELCLFGSQPELANEPGIRYVTRPSDAEVNELLNQATVLLQTSSHEGFCLPVLEAMAAGAAVVVHRRPRQPRLLHRRRELPDAGRQPGRGGVGAAATALRPAAACSPVRSGAIDGRGL